MLTWIDFGNNNIIGMSIRGKLTDREYDTILEKVREQLKKYPKTSLYTEFEDFEGTSIENYFKDLKFGIGN